MVKNYAMLISQWVRVSEQDSKTRKTANSPNHQDTLPLSLLIHFTRDRLGVYRKGSGLGVLRVLRVLVIFYAFIEARGQHIGDGGANG